jgi:hypothetical protein
MADTLSGTVPLIWRIYHDARDQINQKLITGEQDLNISSFTSFQLFPFTLGMLSNSFRLNEGFISAIYVSVGLPNTSMIEIICSILDLPRNNGI